MTEQFFRFSISDICSSKENVKEFICFIFEAHRSRRCEGNACETLIFHDSLKNFFDDNNNTWEVQKQYFKGLWEENRNIFLSIYHLKMFGFVIIFH